MAQLLGMLFGSVLAIGILTLVLGLFAFKNTPPAQRATIIAMIAWLFAGTLYGFGAADGGSFVFRGYFIYGIGALIVGFLYYRHLVKHWTDDDADADIFS